jgi:hypothetical protein
MVLTGYILGLSGLFIGCVVMRGWYTTLVFYGVVHVGCALVLLLVCHYTTARRRRSSKDTHALLQEYLNATDPEGNWVITVGLN